MNNIPRETFQGNRIFNKTFTKYLFDVLSFRHHSDYRIHAKKKKKSFFGNFPFVTPSPTLYPTGSPSQSRCIFGSACSGSCVWRWAPTRHTAQTASSTWSPPQPSQRSETWSSPRPSCSARAGRGCEPAACRTGRSGSLCSRVLASCRGSWWLSQWNVDGRVTTNSKMEFCYKLKNGVGPVQLFTDTGLKKVLTQRSEICHRKISVGVMSLKTLPPVKLWRKVPDSFTARGFASERRNDSWEKYRVSACRHAFCHFLSHLQFYFVDTRLPSRFSVWMFLSSWTALVWRCLLFHVLPVLILYIGCCFIQIYICTLYTPLPLPFSSVKMCKHSIAALFQVYSCNL